MMTEQRLQEIERDNARIECPDCGGMGKFGPIDEDMDEDKCEACDGTGNCSRFPATGELIAEVRRLQEQATLTGAALLDIRHQREAERDAVEAWQQERDAALAERDRAERNEREYRAACEMSIGALRDSRERWEQRAVLAEAERDAARAASQNAHECLFETEQSLSEARRVLRAQDECMVCKAELFRDLTVPHCFDCVVEDEHAEEWDAICAAKAAVLAQDTDA